MKEGQVRRDNYRAMAVAGLIALATLILTIGVIESVLPAMKPPEIPFHNVLYPYVEFRGPANAVWRSPERTPSSRNQEFAVEFTNGDSLRIESASYKLDKKKPASQIRIAILGGSTVRIGTRFDVTLPGALKRTLNSRYPGRDIEVINGGIISAISRQELVFLVTTLIDYEPDILIVYDGINDTGQMLYYEKRPNFPYNYKVMEEAWKQYVAGYKEPLWRQALNRSNILARLWPQHFGATQILETIPAKLLAEDAALRRTYAEVHADNWDKIARVCSAYGIRPVFILQPTSLYPVFPKGVMGDDQSTPLNQTLYANYLVYEDFHNSVHKFAQDHPGLDVVDMSSALPADAFYDGAHVYDEVNDVIANRLAETLAPSIEHIQQPQAVR